MSIINQNYLTFGLNAIYVQCIRLLALPLSNLSFKCQFKCHPICHSSVIQLVPKISTNKYFNHNYQSLNQND